MSALGKVNGSMRGLHQASDRVIRQSEALVRTNRKQESMWGRLRDRIDETEGKYDAVYRAAYRLKSVGQDLMDIGGKGIGVLQKSAEAYGNYEFKLNRAAGAMLVNRDLYGDLSKGIQNVAKEVRLFNVEDVAMATYYWASTTGQQVENMDDLKIAMQGIVPILKAAALTETTMEQAIKGVYSIIKQYGLSLEDTTDITEKLMLMTQRTALEFPDLIESFKMVGPLANSLKIPFEEVAKTLGILGDLGLRGSQAGRGLGMFLTQMVRPAPKGIKAMNKLFKATMQVNDGYKTLVFPKGKFIGLEKFVTLLAKATGKLTDQQRLNYITSIVGTQNAARQIIPLIAAQTEALKKNASVWDESKYSLEGAGKAFDTAFSYLSDSWKGLTGLLQNTFMPIILQVGKAVTEMAKPVIEWLTDMVEKIAQWLEKNPQIADFAVKLLAIGSAVLVAVGAAMVFIGTLMGIVAGVGFVIGAFGAVLAPLTVFVAMVVGAGVAFVQNLRGIKDAVIKFLNSLLRVMKLIVGKGVDFDGVIRNLTTVLKELAKVALDGLVKGLNFLSDVLDSITPEQAGNIRDVVLAIGGLILLNKGMGIAAVALDAIAAALLAIRTASVAGVLGGIGKHVAGLVPNIGKLQGAIRGLLMMLGLASAAAGPVAWAIMAIVAAIAAFVVAYETNFLGFKDLVDGVVRFFVDEVVPVIVGLVTTIVDTIAGIVSAVVGFFQTVYTTTQDVIKWFGELPSSLLAFFNEVQANVNQFIADVIGAIGSFLADLSANWATYLGYIVGFIIGWIVRILATIIIFGVDFLANVGAFISKLPGQFYEWLKNTGLKIADWIKKTVAAMAKGGQDMLVSIINFIKKLPGQVADWFRTLFGNIGKWFRETGPKVGVMADNLVKGIVKFFIELPGKVLTGIASLVGKLRRFFVDLPGKIVGALKGIGRQIVEGIWNGILKATTWFYDRVNDFINGLIDGITNALDIASPSRVMAEIGGYIVEGLAVGIGQTDAAYKAMAKTTDTLIAMASAGSASLGSSLSTAFEGSGGAFNLSTDNTRVLRLEVEVSSPDGSVSKLDTAQLAGMLSGGDLVRAMERMAAVG